MSIPNKVINKKLYLKVKEEIYKAVPKHSAYRSGLLMKTYKERGGKVKKTKEKNLSRWFEEKWVNLTPYAEGLTSSKTEFA